MNILILKLILAPVIIGTASLAGRKWGSAVSGWLVGLPLTSGPVAFLLALSHDKIFAYEAVRGILSGGFSLVAYSLTYAWTAKRFNWVVSLSLSVLVFAGFTVLMQNIVIDLVPLFFAVFAVILLGLRLMPKFVPVAATTNPGKWDIPARILVGTSFILFVTAIAPYIGARLTGLLTTIPLYASILTIFSHRHQGGEAAIGVLRGLLLGMFSFAAFYLVLGLLIRDTNLFTSFGLSTLTALAMQGVSLWVMNHLHK